MATPNDIYNEITRINNAKQGIAEAIEEKGVQVPEGTPIQDFPGKVRQIQQGSPDAVLYTPQELTAEQKQQARTNIGATAPEIFVCTYGVTTFDEVKAAYHAGKLCVCGRNGYYYVFAIWQGDDAPCYFSCGMTGRIYYLRLYPNNSWFNSSYVLEQKSNMSQSVPDDRASETKYPSVKAVFDSLYKWGVVSQLLTYHKDADNGFSYDISDIQYGSIPVSFIEMACIDLYGVVFNETSGYFEMNGLTNISYLEMLRIYYLKDYLQTYTGGDMFALIFYVINGAKTRSALRTLYSRTDNKITIASSYFRMLQCVETLCIYPPGYWNVENIVANFQNSANIGYAFYNACNMLREVKTVLQCGANTSFNNTSFDGCPSLETIRIKKLAGNIYFTPCARLTLASIAYMVENAANTAAITITLHATAYARCQADTTEYTYNGQTYTGIIAYAAAKNITIASA